MMFVTVQYFFLILSFLEPNILKQQTHNLIINFNASREMHKCAISYEHGVTSVTFIRILYKNYRIAEYLLCSEPEQQYINNKNCGFHALWLQLNHFVAFF